MSLVTLLNMMLASNKSSANVKSKSNGKDNSTAMDIGDGFTAIASSSGTASLLLSTKKARTVNWA